MSTKTPFAGSMPYQPIGQNEDPESLTAPSSLPKTSSKRSVLLPLVACLIVGAAIIALLVRSELPLKDASVDSASFFDERGRYVMTGFDERKAMSNFLAGLGGAWGTPLWAFYVNRGQGLTSFGVQNKDNAILKFNTAEKAYQETPFSGFRTFIRGSRNGAAFEHMPFFPVSAGHGSPAKAGFQRDMKIGMNELEIEERADALGLRTNVLYFTVPNEDFPALVRQTTITNTDTSNSVTLDVLDGLAKLIPSGLNNGVLDAMGRTMEAWMNVYNAAGADGSGKSGREGVTQPFFHISQGTADTAQVQIINDGHFALAFLETSSNPAESNANSNASSSLKDLLRFVVDPMVVFDTDSTLSYPRAFFAEGAASLDSVLGGPQGTTSRTPCAFTGASVTLAPGQSAIVTSIYGHAEDLQTFVGRYSPVLRSPGFVSRKYEDAIALVNSVTARVDTRSGSPLFDAYVKQDFLDNVLRGGLPLLMGGGGSDGNAKSPKVYHTFSRIHGDIERDYNFFQIDTTYFSQGPGNFRDVNQNRRLDVFHTPQVGTFNVMQFLSFIQSDGYNPLTVATSNFKVPTAGLDALVDSLGFLSPDVSKKAQVKELLGRPFRLGELFRNFRAAGIPLSLFSLSRDELLEKIAAAATQHTAGQYAQNGYWADHWTYTLDLLEGYLAVFPDKEQELLWGSSSSSEVPFFMSPAVVRPRVDRYSVVDNPNHPGTSTVRVYRAVASYGDPDHPPARASAMAALPLDPEYVADTAGAGAAWQKTKAGDVMTVSPAAKLLILAVLKFSTMDPLGMGVEMEGGKPGWNDAMNGLPGLVGSGMPETFEALRIVRYLEKAFARYNRDVTVPVEFGDLFTALSSLQATYDATNAPSVAEAEFLYWNESNNAREAYRARVVGTFDGSSMLLSSAQVLSFLRAVDTKMSAGIQRALATSPTGMTPTYFYYECSSFEWAPWAGPNKLLAKSFKQHSLPLFLEGPTRHLKVVASLEEKRAIYKTVRSSELYDEPLQMYTMSASLAPVGQEIGRMKAFSPGWLENQSVWLHMSYKFYLELLRAGLYEEFFAEIKTGLVPFIDNARYGRSPIEAASFIVSSAFPDPKLHGQGFLPRLSGSTAEFLSMWAIMMAGQQPFTLDEASGKLQLHLQPILPGWLFTSDGSLSFTFLGNVQVTYVNPERRNTWEITAKSAICTDRSGHRHLVDGGAIFNDVLAKKVRDGEVEAIEVSF